MTPLFRSIHILIDYVRVIVAFTIWITFGLAEVVIRLLIKRDLVPTVFFAGMAVIALCIALYIAG